VEVDGRPAEGAPGFAYDGAKTGPADGVIILADQQRLVLLLVVSVAADVAVAEGGGRG
jgi:hypothetical protein